MSPASFDIRPATRDDLPDLGRLGALLVQKHYAFDMDRFMAPGPDLASGYAWFLGSQLQDDDVAVLVAESRDSGAVIGYVYAGLEPQSWKELRDAAGFVHDVVVDPGAQQSGVGTALMEAALDWLRSHGAPRVVLWTAEQNDTAQRLFARLGFRKTMVEMTRELRTRS
jgi:ribosomal protein S18 acetylase RimI-like enzyme